MNKVNLSVIFDFLLDVPKTLFFFQDVNNKAHTATVSLKSMIKVSYYVLATVALVRDPT
jgi:hypothetical protein